MRIRVEYSGHLNVNEWDKRHAAGEVPDRWPYGFDRLAVFGHELSAATNMTAGPLARVASSLNHRLGGVDWVQALRRSWPREHVDVLLCSDEQSGLPALLRQRLRSNPVPVVTVSVWLSSDDGVRPTQQRLARAVLHRAAAVVTYSVADVDPLRRRYGVPADRLHPVSFGIDADFFPATTWGGDRSVPLVVSAGNDRHRDFDLLVRALTSVRASGSTLRAHVASSRWRSPGESASWLSAAATDAPGIRELYSRADVVVVPTWPNLHLSGLTVTLEAMCSGLPVVVSATPGFEHYVDHGRTGWLVPVGDHQAMSDAVSEVLADPERARQVGAQARQEVLSRFTTTHLAAAVDRIVRDLPTR